MEAKLNKDKAKEIRDAYFLEGQTQVSLTIKYKVSAVCIGDVIRNKSYIISDEEQINYIKSKKPVSQIKDLVGRKFGKLTVLSFYDIRKHYCARWNCLCECGNIKIVKGECLSKGGTKSCGCIAVGRKIVDLVEQKFGKLTVLSQNKEHSIKQVYWNCICDCGKKKIARGSHLISGNITSCGCNIREAMTRSLQKRGFEPRPEIITIQDFEKEARKKHGNKFDYSKVLRS